MDEDGFNEATTPTRYYQAVVAAAEEEDAQVMPICAKHRGRHRRHGPRRTSALFLEDLGLEQSGLDRLIQASYTLLGLISYLTCRRGRVPRLDHHPRHQGPQGRR